MYVSFSDWSSYLENLNKKGILHGGRIIKAFASKDDPREFLGRPEIAVIEMDGSVFTEKEEFIYPERKTYRGLELEAELTRNGFSEIAKEHIRALFRFANIEEIQACQYAMSIKDKHGKWLFQHPFNDLDGLELALRDPLKRSAAIHLDFFSEYSLANLQRLVDFNQREFLVESKREILSLVYGINRESFEGRPTRIESRG